MVNNNNTTDILIIEDNIETLNFLRSYFKSLGYSCKEDRTGRKALEIMKEFKPLLIFLDIILPDISGYDVIKSIKSKSHSAEIPIIFLTALPRFETKKKAEELGAFGVISKPFDLEDLEIVARILKRKRKNVI